MQAVTYRMDKQQGPTVYGTENYIQYPVIDHNRKEYENRYIYIYVCVCIYMTLCCTEEITYNIASQLYFNTLKNKSGRHEG